MSRCRTIGERCFICVSIFLLILVTTACDRQLPYVETIYPTSDTVPENILRMYVQFSSPMKTTGNLDKIKLLDSEGNEIRGAIFKNVYELWSADQTQLTLIFDPARVKSGLQAHEKLGRALTQGSSYQLVIDNLEGINHERIRSFTKNFFVSAPDTVPPSIGDWKKVSPGPLTREAFRMIFPYMLDHMSLHSRLSVVDADGRPISGSIILKKNEKEWQFIPDEAWKTGQYQLLVHGRLSDPAGNNLNGLFDHPVNSLVYGQEDRIDTLRFNVK